MVDTVTDNVNLSNLEQRLQSTTNSLEESDFSGQVECQFRDQTLVVLVHTAMFPSMGPERIFSSLRHILEREFYRLHCPVLIYLMVASQEPPDIFEYEVPPLQDPSWRQQWQYWWGDRRQVWQTITARGLCAGPTPWILATLGLVGVLLAGYGLSRPCGFGDDCSPLTEAEALGQDSDQRLKQVNSLEELIEHQQQLQQAVRLLNPISPWSPQRESAQQLRQTYQAWLRQIDPLIVALQLGQQTTALSELVPQTAAQWEKVIEQWQQAIAQLQTALVVEQLPTSLNRLGRVTQERYQHNLAIAQRRLVQEQRAANDFKQAQATAQLAQQQLTTGKTLDDWQQAKSTWQQAIAQLDIIPKTTTVFPQAEEEQAAYQAQVTAIQQRINQEQLAQQAYENAQVQAQLARQAAAQQNWSTAQTYWQQGLAQLNKISPNTTLANQMTPAIATFNEGIAQAQTQLQRLEQFQNIQNTLQETCTGQDDICSYRLNEMGIVIHLTPTYLQAVQRTAQQAETENNAPTQMELLAHLSSLEKRLQAISQEAGLPVQVYHPNGNLINTYQPS